MSSRELKERSKRSRKRRLRDLCPRKRTPLSESFQAQSNGVQGASSRRTSRPSCGRSRIAAPESALPAVAWLTSSGDRLLDGLMTRCGHEAATSEAATSRRQSASRRTGGASNSLENSEFMPGLHKHLAKQTVTELKTILSLLGIRMNSFARDTRSANSPVDANLRAGARKPEPARSSPTQAVAVQRRAARR